MKTARATRADWEKFMMERLTLIMKHAKNTQVKEIYEFAVEDIKDMPKYLLSAQEDMRFSTSKKEFVKMTVAEITERKRAVFKDMVPFASKDELLLLYKHVVGLVYPLK